METVTNKDVRLFITKHFSDSDLETFCFDYFPDVGNNFTIGMKKNDKIIQLITHCRNRQLMPNLLLHLQQERPRPYQTTFLPEEAIAAPLPRAETPRQSQATATKRSESSFIHEKTGMEFVRIPNETDPPEFWMSKMPVTNAIYKRFAPTWQYESGKENHPVVRVSWRDAVRFCERAGLELPTEAQWEKAARGTDGRAYPWGNDEPTDKLCNFDGNVGGTTLVGNYSPQGDSPYGCVDMSGNVWVWCLNKYKTPEDVAIDTSNALRIVRGGSWRDSLPGIHAAHRFNFSPNSRYFNLGFRVVIVRAPSQ